MTCIHINEAKQQISILIDSGSIHKEVGPYLTPTEVKNFTHGYVFNSTKEQAEQLGNTIKVVDERVLKEKLKEIKETLYKCDCLDELKNEQKKELVAESKKVE
jgi:hypothetical protein